MDLKKIFSGKTSEYFHNDLYNKKKISITYIFKKKKFEL